jgi:hypothetical protein
LSTVSWPSAYRQREHVTACERARSALEIGSDMSHHVAVYNQT